MCESRLALLAAMPLGLAGVLANVELVVPEAHRAAFRRQVANVAADYRAGMIYAACNSERGAGGSIAATQTVALRDERGDYRLTGDKDPGFARAVRLRLLTRAPRRAPTSSRPSSPACGAASTRPTSPRRKGAAGSWWS